MKSETHTVLLDAVCDQVYLQTMPLDKLARKIVQYMPKTGGGQSGGLNVDIGQLLRGQ